MKKIITTLFFFVGTFVSAQNIGINSTGVNPDNSAMLDVASSNSGILVPRVALTATNAAGPIATPATSLLLFNTASAGTGVNAVSPGYYYNAGTPGAPTWVKVATDGNQWSTAGNAGTAPATNFVGTTDAQALVFRTNNTERVRILSGGNVGIGINNPLSTLHVAGTGRFTSLAGAGNRMVIADANGVLGTQAMPTGDITAVTAGTGLTGGGTTGALTINAVATNGLTTNANDIRLGGTLIQATTIAQGTNNMTFNLNSTGDFNIQDNGTTRFSVLDNGRTTVGGVNNTGQFNVTGNSYFSDDIHLRDGAVNTGDVLVRIYDSADDGVIDIYENNAYNIRLHGNGASIFNEQGIASNDFRVESNTQANMFFIDAGSDEIGIRTNAPTSMLHMTNGGVNVGANAMASFNNAGITGVAVSAYNTGTTNGYSGSEGVSNYSGAGNAAGVFGLGINASLTSGQVGVRGTINGRDGYGVLGTRANGAGAGWAGLFINDLGYTGFFGTASDENLKKNIEPIQKALDIVQLLNPVTYDFDIEANPGMGLNTEMEYGFIAQEVQEILPEIVREKNLPTNANQEVAPNEEQNLGIEKFMLMDYTRIIPILTKAMQEQQEIIEDQNTRIETLEKVVLELKNGSN